VALAEFRTGPNELSTVVLDDGTMVRMAPSSRLTVALEPDKREARLDGRAFFAVTPDPERPFDVRTNGGVVVRVLGTRFELQSKRGRTGARLLVLDGKVALSTPAGRSDLVAGDLAVTSPSAPQSIRRVDEPERLLEWMGAWVAFEGTPLHRVVRELEVRLGVPIAIADPSVGERTVIGWFAHEKPEEVIEMVCRVADVDCRWVDGGVVISERAG
jgi:ferric-dicitrate binding protein FerR (iron transport regulator)